MHNGDFTKARHTQFLVIRAPEIGTTTLETCTFIAEDITRDIALLKIVNPRSNSSVQLEISKIRVGTSCGSMGFPLSNLNATTGAFELTERFQGANISGYLPLIAGQPRFSYETDSLMYPGSSGSPGFLINGKVFGLHNQSHPHQALPGANTATDRVAISRWVPAEDLALFAKDNGIVLNNTYETKRS